MPKILKDLWILTSTGVVVYSRVIDERINPQLFGALMSALNTFAEQLSNGGISNFEMSDMRFVLVRRRDFLFVGSALNKTKEKKVIDELKVISDKFFLVYSPNVLVNWDSDINKFSNFGEYIEKSLEKPPAEKLKDAFW
ncbi:MAG: hypothetical protein ACFE85_08910 [Candidatus Hodarchaeota archaeon]